MKMPRNRRWISRLREGSSEGILPPMALTPDLPAAEHTVAEASLAELVLRYRRPLLAYFSRRVSSPAEAEDLVQDVFERVLRGFDASAIGNAEALLFRIAVNLLRDRARRLQRHGTELQLPADAIAEFADALTEDLSPERVVIGRRTLSEVQDALAELGERTRAMFLLYRLEHLKIREIAELYGVTVSAVEKQVSKALLHLTRRLHSA